MPKLKMKRDKKNRGYIKYKRKLKRLVRRAQNA